MLTSRCHMGCPHCMQDAKPTGQHMTEETFRQIVDFCQEAQPMLVSLTGGEPTEHPKWAQYARELLSLKSVKVISIITNGAWIEDTKQRIAMARLIRADKGCVKVQVYSHPKYYQDHDWTVTHKQQFRSIGCITDFTSPIFMQDLGRARQNCSEEVDAMVIDGHVPSCINSHLFAIQATSMQHFLKISIMSGKFCRPLIDPDGGIHMSESWLCPTVAHVSDGVVQVFRKMKESRPCRQCRLYKNFEKLHPMKIKVQDW